MTDSVFCIKTRWPIFSQEKPPISTMTSRFFYAFAILLIVSAVSDVHCALRGNTNKPKVGTTEHPAKQSTHFDQTTAPSSEEDPDDTDDDSGEDGDDDDDDDNDYPEDYSDPDYPGGDDREGSHILVNRTLCSECLEVMEKASANVTNNGSELCSLLNVCLTYPKEVQQDCVKFLLKNPKKLQKDLQILTPPLNICSETVRVCPFPFCESCTKFFKIVQNGGGFNILKSCKSKHSIFSSTCIKSMKKKEKILITYAETETIDTDYNRWRICRKPDVNFCSPK